MTLLGVAMVLMAAGVPRGAAAAEIKVLTAGAFKQVLLALVPDFESRPATRSSWKMTRWAH